MDVVEFAPGCLNPFDLLFEWKRDLFAHIIVVLPTQKQAQYFDLPLVTERSVHKSMVVGEKFGS